MDPCRAQMTGCEPTSRRGGQVAGTQETDSFWSQMGLGVQAHMFSFRPSQSLPRLRPKFGSISGPEWVWGLVPEGTSIKILAITVLSRSNMSQTDSPIEMKSGALKTSTVDRKAIISRDERNSYLYSFPEKRDRQFKLEQCLAQREKRFKRGEFPTNLLSYPEGSL